MNRAQAIAKKCLDCGSCAKEVTLCQVFDCALWQYRTGHGMNTKEYRIRMERAKKNYAAEFKEIEKMGLDISRFFNYGKPPKPRSKKQMEHIKGLSRSRGKKRKTAK